MSSSPLIFEAPAGSVVNSIRVRYQAPETKPLSPFDIAAQYKLDSGVQVLEAKVGNRLLTCPIQTAVSDGVEISSIEEAEQIILDSIESTELSLNKNDDTHFYNQLCTNINRAASIIASLSRRGCGNVVVVGKNLAKYFNTDDISITDRWTFLGTLSISLDVYQGPVGDDEIVVFYSSNYKNGSMALDGPGAVAYDNDKMYLHTIDRSEKYFSYYKDFMKKYTVVFYEGPEPGSKTWID